MTPKSLINGAPFRIKPRTHIILKLLYNSRLRPPWRAEADRNGPQASPTVPMIFRDGATRADAWAAPASASLSIPGEDRAAGVEVIVQTDADDLFAKCGRGGENDRRN